MEEESLLHKVVCLLTFHTNVTVGPHAYVIFTHTDENCKILKVTALETQKIKPPLELK